MIGTAFIDSCVNYCIGRTSTRTAGTATDMFMVATLSGDERIAPSTLRNAFKNPDYGSTDPQTTIINWKEFLKDNWPQQDDRDNNKNLIQSFMGEVQKPQNEGYSVPNVKWEYVTDLTK